MGISEDATRLLEALGAKDAQAAEQLYAIVYDELHALAVECFQHERPDHTLQPTALVNEAFLRLVEQTRVHWKGRAHFLALAARIMRQVLIDHARRHSAEKRGGDMHHVPLVEGATPITDPAPDLLDLDEALQRLAALDGRQSQIVELRFFGGLTVGEVAEALGISKTTVEYEWRMARAWLQRELSGGATS